MVDLDEALAQGLSQARRRPRNFVLIAKGSTCVGLLVKKKPIKEPEVLAARKISGGKIVVAGVCQGDGGPEMVFKVAEEPPAINLARLRQHLLDTTGLKLKPSFLVVPGLEAVDETDDEDRAGPAAESAPAESAPGGSAPAGSAAPGGGGEPGTTAVLETLAKLGPAVQKLIAAEPGQRQTALTRVKRVKAAGESGDVASARAALLELGILVKTGAREGSATRLAQSRLAWVAARNRARAEIEKLERAIVAAYADDPQRFPAVERGVRRLDRLLATLDESLADTLDRAVNAADPAERATLQREAAAEVGRYLRFLGTDSLARTIDDNPFVSVQVNRPLTERLLDLRAELAG